MNPAAPGHGLDDSTVVTEVASEKVLTLVLMRRFFRKQEIPRRKRLSASHLRRVTIRLPGLQIR